MADPDQTTAVPAVADVNPYADAINKQAPPPPPDPVPPTTEPTDDNPYASAIEQQAGAKKALLASSMSGAAETNPEHQSKVVALADKLGLSSDVIEKNYDAINARVQLQDRDYNKLLQHHPEVASWLSIPENAQVAHDEVPQIQQMDALSKSLAGIPHDITGALPDGFMFKKDGTIRGPLHADGTPPVVYKNIEAMRQVFARDVGQQNLDRLTTQAMAEKLKDRFLPSVQAGIEGSIAETLGAGMHLLGGHATALGLTGDELTQGAGKLESGAELLNPGVGGSLGRIAGHLIGDAPLYLLGGEAAGLTELGSALKSVKAATALPLVPKSEYLADVWKTALAYSPIAARSGINTGAENGAAYGSVDFLINSLGPAAFGSKLGLAHAIVPGAETEAAGAGWAGVAGRLMLHVGSQGGIMATTELANALHEYASGVDPDALNSKTLLPRLAQAGAMGSILSGAFHLPGAIGDHMMRQQVSAHAAMIHADALGAFMESAEAIKAAERSPGRFEQLLKGLIPNGQRNKFFQGEDFEGVAKAANLSPEDLATQMGIGDEYKRALATGQMMTVPTHLLLKWGMEHEDPVVKKALLTAARSSAVGINANEALKFYEETPDQLAKHEQELQADVSKAAKELPESDPIYQDILAKYEEAGQIPDAARTNAKLMAAAENTLAAEHNAKVKASGKGKLVDAFEEYSARKLAVTRGDQAHPVEAFDAMLDRVRDGNVPTEKETYGKSLVEFLEKRGVKDPTGELAKAGAEKVIDPNGHDLEVAAERAHDEGYIEDAEPATLVDALKREFAGRTVFSAQNRNEELHQLRTAVVGLAQHMASKGIDPSRSNDEIKAALAGEDVVARFNQVTKPPEGWDKVSKYLTESERANTTNATAQKLVDTFTALPGARDFAAAAKAGIAKRGWYKASMRAIHDVFGPVDAPRFTALLAALSPQTSVEINLSNAVKVWAQWLKAGRPTDPESLYKIFVAALGKKSADKMKAWTINGSRALTAKDPATVTLSGPKVDSFRRNLLGFDQEVTNDAWMANFAHIDQEMFSGSLNVAGTDPGKGHGYKAFSAKVRQAAEILTKETGEVWTPAEVQETVWSWTKTLYEAAEAKGETRGARELLKDGAITDEMIAATPDFATQLHADRVLSHLQEAGYGPALEQLAEFDRSRGSAAGTEADGQGRASLGDHDQASLRRTAKRLEELRAERDAAAAAEAEAKRSAGRAAVERAIGEPEGVAERLQGAPESSNPQPRAAKVARVYMAKAGRPYAPPKDYVRVLGDPAAEERGKAIAAAYEAMEHNPSDPKVRSAYAALAKETIAQYDAMIESGHVVEAIPHGGENPYKTSADMAADAGKGHSWYFRSEDGFGTGESRGNPLLADSGRVDASGNKMLVNDVFRVVHDYYGHAVHGTSFGANGEENAWRAHASMYSAKARAAMTTETRGQNSWVNFGPHGEANRANPAKTVYAEQKTGLLPGWVMADSGAARMHQDDAIVGEGPRGSLEWDANRHFKMTLNGNANLSTVAHEAAHYWFERMGDYAMREDASPRIKADYETMLKFTGYGTHENKLAMMKESSDLQAKITREGREPTRAEQKRLEALAAPHEKFARALEQYLMEGHAPSAELRPVFQRFAIWLTDLYKHLKELVTLTPEVRGVFDRLLATDDAITQVQQELGTSTIFKDQASSGMDDASWGKYLKSVQRERERAQANVFAKAMKTLRRENTRAYNREVDKATVAAANIVRARPVNIAVGEMVNRVDARGNEISEVPKLSRSLIVKEYGSIARMPRGITQEEGGLSLEVAAEHYGFSSAEEMWTALANYKKPHEQIRELADQIVRAQHPELTPEGLHQAAMEAVHANNAHADVLSQESAALAIHALKRPIPQEQMKAIAERMVDETNHQDVNPEAHLRAEQRASDASTKAFLEVPPDYTAAFLHKQRQELSHALYRASMEAQEVIEDCTKLMKRMRKTDSLSMLGHAGGFVITGKNGERLITSDAAEAQALATQYEGTVENYLQSMTRMLEVWNDRPTRFDMDYGAIHDFYREAAAIQHQAKQAFDIITGDRKEKLADVLLELTSRQEDVAKGKVVIVPRDKKGFAWLSKTWLRQFDAGNRTLAAIAMELDGGRPGGPHWEHIVRPLNDAANDEQIRRIHNSQEMTDMIKAWGKRGRKESVYVPAVGEHLSLETRIGVALNAGTKPNLERMMTGDGWDRTQIAAIIKTLDERDLELVKGIWAHLEKKWPEISALHQKLTGIPPAKKETLPIETAFGTLEGGYYPILYDKDVSARAFELTLDKPTNPTLGQPRSGFTQKTVETTGLRLQYGFSALFRHDADTAHYLSHAEAAANLNKILNSPDFRENVVRRFGMETYKAMTERVRNVLEGPRGPQNAFERAVRFIRQRSGLATIGYSAMTVAVHGFGVPQSMHRVGAAEWMAAQGQLIASAGSLESGYAFIDTKSSFMREGRHNFTPEMDERISQGMAGGVLQQVQDHALDGLHMALRVINSATWMAEYKTRIAENPADDARAVALADQAVRDTQGGGQTVDKTRYQDANEFSRVFMQYAIFFTRTYQMLRPGVTGVLDNPKSPDAYWAAAKAFLVLVALPAAAETAFKQLVKPSPGDSTSAKFWAERLAKANLEYLLSTVMGGREIAGVLDGNQFGGPASSRSVASMASAVGALRGLVNDPSASKAGKAGRSALAMTGLLFGIPSNQIDHIIQGILYDREHRSANPAPILFGPPPKH